MIVVDIQVEVSPIVDRTFTKIYKTFSKFDLWAETP